MHVLTTTKCCEPAHHPSCGNQTGNFEEAIEELASTMIDEEAAADLQLKAFVKGFRASALRHSPVMLAVGVLFSAKGTEQTKAAMVQLRDAWIEASLAGTNAAKALEEEAECGRCESIDQDPRWRSR
jgi:hypothetical protein